MSELAVFVSTHKKVGRRRRRTGRGGMRGPGFTLRGESKSKRGRGRGRKERDKGSGECVEDGRRWGGVHKG